MLFLGLHALPLGELMVCGEGDRRENEEGRVRGLGGGTFAPGTFVKFEIFLNKMLK